MKTSEAIDQIALAFAKAQPAVEGAKKEAMNPAFKKKYADLGAVWEAIQKPMADNGLTLIQFPISEDQDRAGVCSRLLHTSGQWFEDSFTMPVVRPDPQAFGSAFTYARRYAAMAIFGVCPEDDDANEASHRDAPQAARSARPEREAIPSDRWTAAELKQLMNEYGVKGNAFAEPLGIPSAELNSARLMLEVGIWMNADSKRKLEDLVKLAGRAAHHDLIAENSVALPEPTPADLTPRADTRMFEGVA